MNVKKTLLKKYNKLSSKVEEKEKKIQDLRDQIKDVKKEREYIRVKLHDKCPHCNGKSFTSERANSYENGRDWVYCRYKFEWLTGEETPPEDWKRMMRFYW